MENINKNITACLRLLFASLNRSLAEKTDTWWSKHKTCDIVLPCCYCASVAKSYRLFSLKGNLISHSGSPEMAGQEFLFEILCLFVSVSHFSSFLVYFQDIPWVDCILKGQRQGASLKLWLLWRVWAYVLCIETHQACTRSLKAAGSSCPLKDISLNLFGTAAVTSFSLFISS